MVQASNVADLKQKSEDSKSDFEPIDVDFHMSRDEWANGLVYIQVSLKVLKLSATELAAVVGSFQSTGTVLPDLVDELREVADFLECMAEACTEARTRMILTANCRRE